MGSAWRPVPSLLCPWLSQYAAAGLEQITPTESMCWFTSFQQPHDGGTETGTVASHFTDEEADGCQG